MLVPPSQEHAPGKSERSQRIACVTGGASGIGLALCREFARSGLTVAMVDVDDEALSREAKALEASGARIVSLRIDVTDRQAWQHAVDEIESRGSLEVLCNNAGLSALGTRVDRMDDAYWDRTIAVNLDSVFAGSRAAARVMMPRGRGHIVNTASVSALGLCSPGSAAYAASKAAVFAFSEVLRQELAESNVGVSVLCPGPVRTQLWRSSRRQRGLPDLDAPPADSLRGSADPGAMDPDLVARAVTQAIARNQFLIATHPEFRSRIAARHEKILADVDAWDNLVRASSAT
jgi:NAD(P)-dependent dehydrogenase (short-subunit alcohol dehydrogenase family)